MEPNTTTPSWRDSLSDGKKGLITQLIIVLFFSVLAFRLRGLIDIRPYTLDVDSLNFGLGALTYDVPKHMPHPPGYPGWSLFLKGIALITGQRDPLSIALMGGWVASALTVPLAWWSCRSLIIHANSENPVAQQPILRPLVAAFIAVVHPALWYYGGDGQNHAGEAAGTLLLLGLTVLSKRHSSVWAIAGLSLVFGLAGSLRPTLSLLCAPILVWAVWGRPARHWLTSFVFGAAGVALWYGPMVMLSGGWEMYQRATDALIGEQFIRNFSVFGDRTHAGWRMMSLNMVMVSLLLCGVPFLAWGRKLGKASKSTGWRLTILIVVLFNVVFYSLLFISEVGYMISVAALSCMVPATWSTAGSALTQARRGLTLAITATALFFLPPKVSVWGLGDSQVWVPSLAHVTRLQSATEAYFTGLCEAEEGQGLAVVTDNPVLGHTRSAPIICPNTLAIVYLRPQIFNPEQSGGLVYTPVDVITLPTEIVFEKGPPTTKHIPTKVGRVALARDATQDYATVLRASERCAPLAGADGRLGPVWPDVPMVWALDCMPKLEFGENVLHLTPQ